MTWHKALTALLTTCIHSCGIHWLKPTSAPTIILSLSAVILQLCYCFTFLASSFHAVPFSAQVTSFAPTPSSVQLSSSTDSFVHVDSISPHIFPFLCLLCRLTLARFFTCAYFLCNFPRPNNWLGGNITFGVGKNPSLTCTSLDCRVLHVGYPCWLLIEIFLILCYPPSPTCTYKGVEISHIHSSFVPFMVLGLET